jgi:hypothetical protein
MEDIAKLILRGFEQEVTITLDNVCIVKSSLTHPLFAALLPILPDPFSH